MDGELCVTSNMFTLKVSYGQFLRILRLDSYSVMKIVSLLQKLEDAEETYPVAMSEIRKNLILFSFNQLDYI